MRFAAKLVAAAMLGLPLPGVAAAETVLRVVPQADLRVLDPSVTAATITRIWSSVRESIIHHLRRYISA